jgi:hypothetical protein
MTTADANYLSEEVKAAIGVEVGPILALHAVEASEVRRFYQAVMDPAPRYWDTNWSSASRYGGPVAPPAFPMHAFRREPAEPDPLELGEQPGFDGVSRAFRELPPLKISLPRVLNGGYRYEFFRYARLGEQIMRTSRYLDITQREGRTGPMVLVRIQDRYTTSTQQPLLTVVQTSILR